MVNRIRISVFLLAVIGSTQATICPHLFFGNVRYSLCPDRETCIRQSLICNSDYDCPDGADELYCDKITANDCQADAFQCSSGRCISRTEFCDGETNCEHEEDELFCGIHYEFFCPKTWFRCDDSSRCIPMTFKCNQHYDCPDESDEIGCEVATRPTTLAPYPTPPSIPNTVLARRQGITWLLNRRKNGTTTNRWGQEVHRIASALYLADEHSFTPGNKAGEEIGYELTIQLLHKLSGNNTIRNQELALYIQALTVTCSDPRDFFGHNLVAELRRRVEASNYTNPFEILTLCNVKDNMTNKDVERVTTAFDSPYRPFWTDTQAIATIALQCLSTFSNVQVDERMVRDMQGKLKVRQFRNGTVDNFRTTALVAQALFYNDSYKEFFNLSGAISVLLQNQDSSGSWGSIRNSYYILPALDYKSLLNISSKHCIKEHETEEETLKKLQDTKGEKFVVQYSVWMGNDIDLGRTWRVRMKTSKNISFYDVIETVRKLDDRHNVTYNVIDYKPYVSALYGKQDDPDLDMYWFTYVRSSVLPEVPKHIEASPVDVIVKPNEELILWYKPGKWSEGPLQAKVET